MTPSAAGRLVILSGPSCVGKSPLDRALDRFYPDLRHRLQKVVLFNSRDPRPGERDGADYHFRPRTQIEALRPQERFAVMDVRDDMQALDLAALTALLERGDAFFEGNPFVGRLLQTHSALAPIRRLSVFLAPLSKDEILSLKDPARNLSLPDLVTDVMRRKLLRRCRPLFRACGVGLREALHAAHRDVDLLDATRLLHAAHADLFHQVLYLGRL